MQIIFILVITAFLSTNVCRADQLSKSSTKPVGVLLKGQPDSLAENALENINILSSGPLKNAGSIFMVILKEKITVGEVNKRLMDLDARIVLMNKGDDYMEILVPGSLSKSDGKLMKDKIDANGPFKNAFYAAMAFTSECNESKKQLKNQWVTVNNLKAKCLIDSDCIYVSRNWCNKSDPIARSVLETPVGKKLMTLNEKVKNICPGPQVCPLGVRFSTLKCKRSLCTVVY